jgi:hypothetical protein
MNLRHFINLVETPSITYFHGSRREYRVGVVLKGRKVSHEDKESKMVETILERTKPVTALSRHESVYMVNANDIDLIEKAGGYADYIYEVQPLDDVHVSDVFWWAEIYNYMFDYLDANDPKVKASVLQKCESLAAKYWSGSASSKPSWEYRVRRAKVTNLVGGYNFEGGADA